MMTKRYKPYGGTNQYGHQILARGAFCLFTMLYLLVPAQVQSAVWDPRETEVLNLVNLQRSFRSLNSLNADDRLHDAALGHSQAMSTYDFFSHTTLGGPNLNSQPRDRIAAAGYDLSLPSASGENIAAGYGSDFLGITPVQMGALDAARDVMYGTTSLSALSVFFGVAFASWDMVGSSQNDTDWNGWGQGWMGSSGHRNNILSTFFDDLGVGYVWEFDDTYPTAAIPYRTYWTQDFAAGDTQVVPLPAAAWLFVSSLLAMVAIQRRNGYGGNKA
ncbi:MAG: hypothetical protein KDI43_02110 [Gammaproteobacteria bacterium]|nr:hypothetical protein [Gammaproteobacteria bacterium]